MGRIAVLLVALFMLSGCYQWATYLEEDAMLVHDASQKYIEENIQTRRAIREMCLKILAAEIQQDIAQGKYDLARTRLGLAYPPLVTPSILKQKDLSSLDVAVICE